MKFIVTACIGEDQVIETNVNSRIDSGYHTLARKFAEALKPLIDDRIVSYTYEMPNIWTNGCFPSMWLKGEQNNFIPVYAKRITGGGVFY